MNLYTNYGLTYFPFRLRAGKSDRDRNWLGGSSPIGVMPRLVVPISKHLCTLALTSNYSVTLFTSFNYKATEDSFSFFKGTYKLHDESAPIIQFVVHPSDPRLNEKSPVPSELPLFSLAFGEPSRDPPCEDIGALGTLPIFADHKIGGVPYFGQIEGEVGRSIELLKYGWVHLVQLAFPSNADSPMQGNWPFGEATFHVFAKQDAQAKFRFCYCWG